MWSGIAWCNLSWLDCVEPPSSVSPSTECCKLTLECQDCASWTPYERVNLKDLAAQKTIPKIKGKCFYSEIYSCAEIVQGFGS